MALQTGPGRTPLFSKASSTSRIARSRGVPEMTILFPWLDRPSKPKAVSAITLNRNGSAFCLNNAAACLVFASIILSHQSCRFCAEGAYKVYMSVFPRCLIRNGNMSFSSFGPSSTVVVTSVLPERAEPVEVTEDMVFV